jgi:predicted lipoprotein with Yx(FWY)xxD motif
MKRLAALLLTLVFLTLPIGVAAQNATPSSTEASPAAGTPEAVGGTQATIFVRESGTLGRYFSTPAGLTLYVSDGDTTANQSTCTGDCAIAWIPFSATEPLSLPPGITGELALFDREDGSTQLSYNGMPLYTYNADSGSGSTLGDGVGSIWRLATPGDQLGVPATPVAPTAVDMGTPRAAGDVTVSMREFYIQSAAVTFSSDTEYTFNITNLGTSEHQFVIEPAGAQGEPVATDEGAASVATIAPGETATLIVTFPDTGHFQLASHAATDYEQGMALDITVV